MSTYHHWRTQDTIAAVALFLAAAGFTLWQNAHVAVLWDLAYLLDSSFRISLGQVPYREFPFAHAPLTFLIQAAIIKLFGRVYWHVIAYAVIASGLAIIITWRIALRLMPHRWLVATLLCTTLVPLGIYSIYPHPIYDSDCILTVLVALFLLQRAETSLARAAWAGAAAVFPLFFKQNIGLIFLATTLTCVLATTIARRIDRKSIRAQLAFFTGSAITLITALILLHFTVGLHNYVYWTITFAAQRRLPGLPIIVGIYHQTSLLWALPATLIGLALLHFHPRALWSRLLAAALFATPFLYAAVTFFLADDPSDRTDALLSLWPHLLLLAIAFALFQLRFRPTFVSLLPVILLATIHGTFLSQQLWGSTYAIWPLLVLMLVMMLPYLRTLTTPLTAVVVLTFILCGTAYALGHDRLSYSHIDPATDGAVAHATLPSLRGMSTAGGYLPAFEQLIRTTNALIPENEGVVLLPGQDPFYFASGRVPQFPVLLLDPATNPYSPREMALEASRRNIRWLIVNKNLQLIADPVPDLNEYFLALGGLGFVPVKTIDNYTIFQYKPWPR